MSAAIEASAVAPAPGSRRDAARRPLRVGVLVDLALRREAGGHVKCWERLAEAAVGVDGLDLTVHFQGPAPRQIALSPSVRYQLLPPVFSTAWLVGPIVDHTDLAPWHHRLAAHLAGYDVIHTTDAFFCYARTAARVSRRRGVPLVSSIHTNIPDYARLTMRKLFARALGDAAARLAPLGEAMAAIVAGRLERRLHRHLAAATIAIGSYRDGEGGLRRGLDRRRFDPARRDRAWLEQRFALPPGDIVGVYAGTLNAAKNAPFLVPVVQRARARGARLHLLAAGRGPEAAELARALGEAATLPGPLPQDELARVYASADLFLFPSTIDESGNAVLEAMASGLPCLVADGSGVARRMGDCGGVRVLPGGEAEAWAAAVAELARQPDLRARMGTAARACITARVPDWRTVLLEDLLPAWQAAARQPPPR